MHGRIFSLILLAAIGTFAAVEPEAVSLPKPDTHGGKPLMQALSERRSSREFNPEKLPPEVLSNLMWAAYGVNRPDSHRTAPSAMNRQAIDVYALTSDGAYLYNAKSHRLDAVAAGDIRALAGTQSFVADAPLNLVYVTDYSKFGNASESDKILYSGAETGSISQNVYLYCASEGLSTVVRASINRDALAKALKLSTGQRITLAQTVGYPRRAN